MVGRIYNDRPGDIVIELDVFQYRFICELWQIRSAYTSHKAFVENKELGRVVLMIYVALTIFQSYRDVKKEILRKESNTEFSIIWMKNADVINIIQFRTLLWVCKSQLNQPCISSNIRPTLSQYKELCLISEWLSYKTNAHLVKDT